MARYRAEKSRNADGRSTRVKQKRQQAASALSQASLPDRIRAIPSMLIADLADLVDRARHVDHVQLQRQVLEACLRRILGASPRPEQVRVMRRLIFGNGDTLLIARTGWGKSIIFHAFSILTRKITLQVIPLSKLGDEQLNDIKRIGCTKPCLVTATTKQKEGALLSKIVEGEYTHVLLGPEQASSPEFRKILRRPEFQSRIGLVAIDECHTMKQWKDFRPQFTMLYQLRILLPRGTVWFACSATLDSDTEQEILSSAGFRIIGPLPYQTEVIRTSVDRPDIAICVRPIPRGRLLSFDTLFFTVSAGVEGDQATPHRIAKTVVFVDGRVSVAQAAQYLRHKLMVASSQYTVDARDQSNCVLNVVQTYTSGVTEFDQEQRYQEFKKPSSIIRVMVATTALGMGINIPDIEVVVVWKFPIGYDIGDVWQRLGRGGRGPGRRSRGYLLLPYWLFDTEGADCLRQLEASQPRKSHVQPPKVLRNRLPSARTAIRTQGIDVLPDKEVDTSTPPDIPGMPRVWSAAETTNRAQIPLVWRDLANSSCHRKVILSYLGEDTLPPAMSSIPMDPALCCSRCNPQLFPDFPEPPVEDKLLGRPKAGTMAALALTLIDQWSTEQAVIIFDHAHRRFPVSADAFIPKQCRWELAALFVRGSRRFDLNDIDVLQLSEQVPSLRTWRYADGFGPALVERLRRMPDEVAATYQDAMQQRRERLLALRASSQTAAITPVATSATSSQTVALYQEEVARKDDRLATLVARRLVEKAVSAHNSQVEGSVSQTHVATSSLRQWVEDLIAVPSTPTSTPGPFDDPIAPEWSPLTQPDMSPGIREAAERLAEIRASVATFEDIAATRTVNAGTPTPGRSDTAPQVNRKRSSASASSTPTKKGRTVGGRQPLQELDRNGLALSFMPVSARGRVRQATAKGRENSRLGDRQ